MVQIISDKGFVEHITGRGHPECSDRVTVIEKALEAAGLKSASNTLAPRMATDDDILLCHEQSYLQLVKEEVAALKEQQQAFLTTGDVVISSRSLEVAYLAAGAALTAVDVVMSGSHDSKAFAIVRPPGHHAGSSYGMGFCLFNNIAIGARYCQKRYGLERILIADWDVHHGNGTQDIFYNDPSVFYFSTHELGIYPGSGAAVEKGAGPAIGTTLNSPVKAGDHSRDVIIEAFEKALTKAMDAFKPQLLFISAGFDAHCQDPLGHLNLSDDDFAHLTRIVVDIADKHARGQVISLLEGGYDLAALASASVAHVAALK